MIPLPNQSLAAAISIQETNSIIFTARCPCGQGDSTWTARRTPGVTSTSPEKAPLVVADCRHEPKETP